jgi:vitamin B12 transporter
MQAFVLSAQVDVAERTSDSSKAIRRYNLANEVTVTGSRLPDDGASPRRMLITINRAEIEQSQSRSVEELLRNIAGVDVRQRGAFGVQADISIRGGTFEQTLVMINGIKMIDPQTGHHAMNIPLVLDDIERIEVLKGAASRQYGPNAFNGAINIITRKYSRPAARLQLMGGQFGLWEMSLSAGVPVQISDDVTLLTRASIMRRKSDGYRENTDFDIWTAAAATQLLAGEKFSIEASVNYTEKKFGANGFYSLTFPTQYEETKTLLSSLIAKVDVGIPIRIAASWRRNNDYFLLRRENPSFYQNVHTSNTVSLEAQTTLQSSLGATALGVEYAADMLESTNLGNRQRTRFSVFGEHRVNVLPNFTVEGGATALYNSGWGWTIAPGLDAAWQVSETVGLHVSAANSFRIPTYTELFYRDRSIIGDSTVQPERAWTFEVGGVWREGIAEVKVGLFRRNAVNLIDYVRNSTTAIWQAQNLSSSITNGADAHVTLRLRDAFADTEQLKVVIPERMTASYTYLDPYFATQTGLQSRYALDQLRHQAALTLVLRWFDVITNEWRVRYERRLNIGTDAAFVDVRFGWTAGAVEIFAEGTNVLNSAASDFTGLPLPGRWLRAGVAVSVAALWK